MDDYNEMNEFIDETFEDLKKALVKAPLKRHGDLIEGYLGYTLDAGIRMGKEAANEWWKQQDTEMQKLCEDMKCECGNCCECDGLYKMQEKEELDGNTISSITVGEIGGEYSDFIVGDANNLALTFDE